MKQISVVTRARPGLIAEITQVLASRNINIDNLVSEAIGEHAVTIMTVDRYDEALKILQTLPDINAVTEDAILVRVDDKPGELAKLAQRFQQAGVAMRSIRIVRRCGEHSVVAISAERTQDALQLVEDLIIS